MSYTPMSDLGQQGLFDITRLLLQQPDLAALSETLTRLVQQSALADEAAIILWNAGNHRAARYACDEAGHPVSYEDETVLAHGPVRRLLSRPDALHCDHETFADTWPQLIRSGLYRPFGYYSLLPLAADGRIFGGCEFLRRDNRPWSEKEFQRLHTFAQIVAVVTEQIQNRVSNNVDYDLLCHERDNFRILVAITNAVLSRLDIDELVSEVAKEIHRYFRIDAISVVLRSDRKGSSTSIPRIILTPATRFTTRARWMKPAPSPSACSKAKRCCCLICTNMTLSRRMRKCSSRCGAIRSRPYACCR